MSERQVKDIIEDLNVCAEQLNDMTQYWKKSVCLDAASAIEQLMERLKQCRSLDALRDENEKSMGDRE